MQGLCTNAHTIYNQIILQPDCMLHRLFSGFSSPNTPITIRVESRQWNIPLDDKVNKYYNEETPCHKTKGTNTLSHVYIFFANILYSNGSYDRTYSHLLFQEVSTYLGNV